MKMKKLSEVFSEQHREKGRFKPIVPHMVSSHGVASPRGESDSAKVSAKEQSETETKMKKLNELSPMTLKSYKEKAQKSIAELKPHAEKGEYKDIAKNIIKRREKGLAKMNEQEDVKEYDYEGDMVKSDLRSIMANAQRIIDMVEDNDNLPEWCQSKVTVAEDYISTVANYMTAEMNEEVETPPMHVRSMYTKQYAKHGGTISTAKTASAKAYDAVEKMHGKEMRDKLEAFHRRNMNEEVEQIDELKKSTLVSYINKAADNARVKKDAAASSFQYKYITHGMKKSAGGDKRLEGIKSAAKRLAKEETEQIDEVSDATLASYKEKAKKSADELESQKKFGKALTRRTGILRAVGKQVGRAGEKIGQMAKEEVEQLDEKNKPTNPELWSRAISLAKQKFDVYPSAYANGWASKWYKSKGGGWRSVSEAVSPAQQAAIAISMKKTGKKPKNMKEEKIEEGSWHTVKHTTGPTKVYVPSKDEDEKSAPFEGGKKPSAKVIPGKYGAGYSTARHLARMAMKKQAEGMKKSPMKEESKKANIIKDIMKKKKEVNDDKFQADPEISKSITRNY